MKLGKLVEDVSYRKRNNKQPTDDAQGSYQPPSYSNWDCITVTHSGHADGGPPPADRDGLQLWLFGLSLYEVNKSRKQRNPQR